MYSIQSLARLPRPAPRSARLLDQARERIAAGTVASLLDGLPAHT